MEDDIKSMSFTLNEVSDKLNNHAVIILQSHSDEIAKLNNSVKEIEDSNKSLSSRITSLQKQEQNIPRLSYFEVREHILKENNIIIFGLPESEPNVDQDHLTRMMRSLPNRYAMNINLQNVICSRIGSNGHSRPLIVRF